MSDWNTIRDGLPKPGSKVEYWLIGYADGHGSGYYLPETEPNYPWTSFFNSSCESTGFRSSEIANWRYLVEPENKVEEEEDSV